MNSLWEAAKKSPFLTSANCEAKMSTTDNQLVANRTIAAAAAGKIIYFHEVCPRFLRSIFLSVNVNSSCAVWACEMLIRCDHCL